MNFNALTSQAGQGVERVVALNVATAKSAVEDGLAAGKELSQSKDPKAAMAAAGAQMQPDLSGATAHNQQLSEIIKDIHDELTNAPYAHVSETKRI